MPLANVTRIRCVAAAFALGLLLCGRIAQAAIVAATPNCDASGSSFKCELQGFLHFLYAAAGVLALVLVVVVAAAVHIYKKNKSAAEDGE